MPSVAIAGAGITGLTAAYYLQDTCEVHLFEAQSRAGGVIRSERRNGYLVEHGPNTIRGGGKILEEVVQRLDLAEKRIYPGNTAKKRFIVRDGAPVPVPLNPFSFITSPLFSASAKLRLLKEPFLSSPAPPEEETVRDFAARRFGDEIADYAIDPFMAGVYAGDPDNLSAAHVLERLHDWEQQHGSVVRGALFGRTDNSDRAAGTKRRIFTFPNGLETLSGALAEDLQDILQVNTSITAAAPREGRWQVTLDDDKGRRTKLFDAVLLTVPLFQLDNIELEVSVGLDPLLEIPYPPLAILALGFHHDQVSHPLDGFGLLVPGKEPFQILGTLFSSSLAPGRAPDNHVLLTSFVGGMRAPELARLDGASVMELVQNDLANLLGIRGRPSFYTHIQKRRTIPQYVPGYQRVLDTIDRLEEQHPGLFLAGNFRGGISVGDAMTSGAKAGERILAAV